MQRSDGGRRKRQNMRSCRSDISAEESLAVITTVLCVCFCLMLPVQAALPGRGLTGQAAARMGCCSPLVREAAPGSLAARPPARHAVVLGAGYQPGPGLRLLGGYEYLGFHRSTVSFMLGWSEAFFGAVTFGHNVPLGAAPWQQLALTFSLFSEYEPDRMLDGAETDQRRSGGRFRVEWPMGGLRSGRVLLQFEGEHGYVHLQRNGRPNRTTTLTAVGAGGHYTQGRRDTDEVVLWVAPRVRLGISRGLGIDFATWTASGGLYKRLVPPVELFLEGRAEWASAGTPGFERGAFGGLSGVRGFRKDATVARRLWVLQNELWIRGPGADGLAEGIHRMLYQHLRLAGFVDIGGIDATAEMASGLRAGLGLGLRFLLGDMTLRLDWAHRFDAVRAGRLHGGLYASISTALLPR